MNRRYIATIFAVSFVIPGCEKAKSEQAPPAAASAAAPTRASAAPVDLCSLVTETEAEDIVGKPLAAPQKQAGGDCWYLRDGGSDFAAVEFILSILPVSMSSTREFDKFIADQVKDMNESFRKSGLGTIEMTVEPARNVGAPAYFVDPGLYVLKGNRILTVGLGGEKGVAVARTAIARMP